MIARLSHRAEEPVQRLAATTTENYDDERAVFRGRDVLDFFEHRASNRFFGGQDFVIDLPGRKLRQIVTFSGIVSEPDVSSDRTTLNSLSSGCRHLVLPISRKDARL